VALALATISALGVGISQGYATLGQIGFAERMDYTAIGTVTNLAARLCAVEVGASLLRSKTPSRLRRSAICHWRS
jgi:class 3 adenylate cyclase